MSTAGSKTDVSFEQVYNYNHELLKHHINNDNVRMIILYGEGGSGKTHLTEKLRELLTEKEYIIYPSDVSYNWTKEQFIGNMDTPGKKMIHMLFEPYSHWNIKNVETVRIHMAMKYQD